jgi:PAS domain S-box-containing protein
MGKYLERYTRMEGEKNGESAFRSLTLQIGGGAAVFVMLYFASRVHYLLFHSLAEIFSILVAFGIFVVALNSRTFLENGYLILLGIAYLFIGGFDILHTLAYKGMGIFQPDGSNLATQMWISARYLESVSLLIAPVFLKKKFRFELIFFAYFVCTLMIMLMIFAWEIFPVCYIEGKGLTPFKKISEYVISLILVGAVLTLVRKKDSFDEKIFSYIVVSIILTIFSELIFTFYFSVYDMFNLTGHFIYKAIIEKGIVQPFDLMYRNLKQSEGELKREKEFIERLIDSAQSIVLVLDEKNRILRFNSYMEEITGYRINEVKGKDFFKVFVPDRFKLQTKELFKNSREGVIEHSIIGMIRTKTGAEREIEWYNRPLEYKAKSIIGLVAIGQDVTERRHAQKDHEQLIIELQDALSQVRALKNMLHVCPYCNRIEDENGYWHTLDYYSLVHSSEGVSQHVCPDCARKYHGT